MIDMQVSRRAARHAIVPLLLVVAIQQAFAGAAAAPVTIVIIAIETSMTFPRFACPPKSSLCDSQFLEINR